MPSRRDALLDHLKEEHDSGNLRPVSGEWWNRTEEESSTEDPDE